MEEAVVVASPTEPAIVNNFSINVATPNGSGSQTSNGVLLRALFKMGIAASGKNLFPSNIQGLPTWYIIRLSKDGYAAHRDPYEIAVCMNGISAAEDMSGVAPGGVVLYDDALPIAARRPDVTYYPMPVSKLVKEANLPFELRDYIANMVYVGVLSYVLGIDMDEIEAAVSWNFGGKPKPIQLNMDIARQAYSWAAQSLTKQDPYRVERVTGFNEGKLLIEGNTAAALGAIFGGVTVVAWYPITPASSLAEALNGTRRSCRAGRLRRSSRSFRPKMAGCRRDGGRRWLGRRQATRLPAALTDLTGFAGLAYFAEVPAVFWDVQRIGPSTGLPRALVRATSRRPTSAMATSAIHCSSCQAGGMLRVRLVGLRRGTTPNTDPGAQRPGPRHECLGQRPVCISGKANGSRQGPDGRRSPAPARSLGAL
jgi:2-oxoglutarate ferredoxin oxidoreductase subunit alpha